MIFAANHQSHFDTPAILQALPPRWRYRVAPAMAKEFFKAHFFPEQFTRPRPAHQQPQLLSGRALLQRVPASAAGIGHAADAALYWRAGHGRLFGPDLPEGRRDGDGEHRTVPARDGDDRRPARRPGRPGAARRAWTVSSTTPGSSPCADPHASVSARRCASKATDYPALARRDRSSGSGICEAGRGRLVGEEGRSGPARTCRLWLSLQSGGQCGTIFDWKG